MKATGIVRRMDDLGRVLIPKELRRTLKIREGDALEIYTDSNGAIILKKYVPYDEKDWLKVHSLMKSILNSESFCVYDEVGQKKTFYCGKDKEIPDFRLCNPDIEAIRIEGNAVAYLWTDASYDRRKIAAGVLNAFLREE
jgi:AbrB family looped-hinge helix DNA binding protein